MSERRLIHRGFFLTWALLFAASVVVVQTARAVHGPVEVAVEPESVAAVVLVPPKPDGAQREEGGGSGTFTWEGCKKLSGAYADACFAGLAWQRAERDPDGALEACGAVEDASRRQECVADVAEGHTLADRVRAEQICQTIAARRWRDQCTFGMALALVRTEPAAALEVCERAGVWTRFCRHDVNGERAVQDADAAVAYCAALAAEEQASCWHGVGKYLARVEPARAARACGLAPVERDLRGQCVHGAGWAMAERSGEAAAASCEQWPFEHDSCLMGVAYHSKRLDPERALEVCGRVQAAAEAQRCREVVGRGALGSAGAPSP